MIMDQLQNQADAFVIRMMAEIQPEYRKLAQPVKRLVIEALHDRMAKHLNRPCVIRREREPRPEVKDALDQASRILSMCREILDRGTDSGEDFAGSVSEGVEEVAATIEERNHVTESQQRALDNWESGVQAWIR